MTETRWKVRPNKATFYSDDHAGAGHWTPKFRGEFGVIVYPDGIEVPRNTIYGDSIAEVIDEIHALTTEVP